MILMCGDTLTGSRDLPSRSGESRVNSLLHMQTNNIGYGVYGVYGV